GFVRLSSKWSQKYSYLDLQSMSWSSAVKSLRTASFLLTGRHHAVYAACKARVPFIALRGNTHKIEGLIETAGVAVPVLSEFNDVKTAVTEELTYDAECKKLFDWMSRQVPWSIT